MLYVMLDLYIKAHLIRTFHTLFSITHLQNSGVLPTFPPQIYNTMVGIPLEMPSHEVIQAAMFFIPRKHV